MGIQKNKPFTGTIDGLKAGETLLTKFRKVSNGFISVELAEVKTEKDAAPNAAYLFNKSDDRFSRRGVRRAWQNGNIADLQELLGLPLEEANWETDEEGREVVEVNILNPVITHAGTDYKMRVQIVESTEPDEWRATNYETAAKRKGKNGDFILHNGEYIFTYATIVFSTPEDVFLESDEEKERRLGQQASKVEAPDAEFNPFKSEPSLSPSGNNPFGSLS